MKRCAICGTPAVRLYALCTEHFFEWTVSPESKRVLLKPGQSLRTRPDLHPMASTAVNDFVRRRIAERRNSP